MLPGHSGKLDYRAEVRHLTNLRWRPMPATLRRHLGWPGRYRRDADGEYRLLIKTGQQAPPQFNHALVPPAGFEPAISTLKGLRPGPLDDGGLMGTLYQTYRKTQPLYDAFKDHAPSGDKRQHSLICANFRADERIQIVSHEP